MGQFSHFLKPLLFGRNIVLYFIEEEHIMTQNYRDKDMEAWNSYRTFPSPENRSALLRRFDGVINSQVNKWAGPVPRETLLMEARAHAAKAIDPYDPAKGAALATHVANAIKPISRTVYTYQNAVRAPENVTRAIGAYKQSLETLTDEKGRAPNDEELAAELGWEKEFLDRVKRYDYREFVESQPVAGGQFGTKEDYLLDDELILESLFRSLSDEEKLIFSSLTGYGDAPIHSNGWLAQQLGVSPSQITARKDALARKITNFLNRPSLKGRFGA